jgi:hypothetical protein
MATGDLRWFGQALHDLGNKLHDMDSDDLRIALITGAATPLVTTAAPHWAGTGTTNFATSQVATGTVYTGPIALAGRTWTLVSGSPILRADIVTVLQDAAGFTNARWGIVFNNTDANKRAIGFVDLGSDRSIVGGALTIDWAGGTNDLFSIAQPA